MYTLHSLARTLLGLSLGVVLVGCGDDGGSTDPDTGDSSDSGGSGTDSGSTTDQPGTETSADGSSTASADESSTSSADTGDTGTDSGSDSGSETGAVDCSALDADACEAEAACAPIEGREVVMIGETWCYDTVDTVVGCRPADQVCSGVETFACENVEVTTTYRFPDSCVPDAWLTEGCPNLDPTPEECVPV